MNPDIIMKKARAANFIDNNGMILRALNMIATDFNQLSAIRKALGMDSDEYSESLNYLIEAGYVRIRKCGDHENAELADHDLSELEGKLTAKGVQLLFGAISDKSVDV